MLLKIFGAYRYQMIEDDFNAWSKDIDPFILKSILDTTAIPKEGGVSLYFTLAVFYQINRRSVME